MGQALEMFPNVFLLWHPHGWLPLQADCEKAVPGFTSRPGTWKRLFFHEEKFSHRFLVCVLVALTFGQTLFLLFLWGCLWVRFISELVDWVKQITLSTVGELVQSGSKITSHHVLAFLLFNATKLYWTPSICPTLSEDPRWKKYNSCSQDIR